ncbi:riboflavin kinase [Steccherinum ochraceum]|uniref:Riboflavin kinase n=1 Tax=Steccherinum ochraceum TaxID=92696 RepID=A0A4R0RWT0_9APHY|nr:riboflavin kinase [Steccherinum ochraceum]
MVQTAEIVSEGQPAAAPVRTDTARKLRPEMVGPDTPEEPFPIYLSGKVAKGFGRGGKELGCPTANLEESSLVQIESKTRRTGVYYGYARVAQAAEGDNDVLPMVMSVGYNPYYKNEKLTAEIHVMHEFKSDFYGYEMRAVILGYIRPEYDYVSRDALIEDIDTDKQVALRSLSRSKYEEFKTDKHFFESDSEHPNGDGEVGGVRL